MAECNVSELLEAGKCFACLTQPQLDAIELQLLCEILAVGGGGGSSSGVQCGNYAGAEPTFTPTTACAVAIDLDTQRIWWFYSGVWN